MNMQTRIYAGVTLDVANLTDLYAAIALVDGAVIVHTATDKFGNKRPQRPAVRQLDTTPSQPTVSSETVVDVDPKPRVAPASSSKHAVAKADPRAVYAKSIHHSKEVIDVTATLRRMGLSVAELESIKTKRGTLEYTVKRSLMLNRRYERNRRAGARQASLALTNGRSEVTL